MGRSMSMKLYKTNGISLMIIEFMKFIDKQRENN